MTAAIQRAREALNDPMVSLGEKIGVIGIIAIALVSHDFPEELVNEARALVTGFWREMEVVR